MQELRLQFLQCREQYMTEVIADLEEQSAYDHLKRLTDIHRLHLFDVVMQYRAIFSDDQNVQVGLHSTLSEPEQVTASHHHGPCHNWLCIWHNNSVCTENTQHLVPCAQGVCCGAHVGWYRKWCCVHMAQYSEQLAVHATTPALMAVCAHRPKCYWQLIPKVCCLRDVLAIVHPQMLCPSRQQSFAWTSCCKGRTLTALSTSAQMLLACMCHHPVT